MNREIIYQEYLIYCGFLELAFHISNYFVDEYLNNKTAFQEEIKKGFSSSLSEKYFFFKKRNQYLLYVKT